MPLTGMQVSKGAYSSSQADSVSRSARLQTEQDFADWERPGQQFRSVAHRVAGAGSVRGQRFADGGCESVPLAGWQPCNLGNLIFSGRRSAGAWAFEADQADANPGRP